MDPLESIINSLNEQPNQGGSVGSKAPEFAAKQDIGPNRMAFTDELKQGDVFFTPDRCPGYKRHPLTGEETLACAFPAATHTEGQYHMGTVMRTRDIPIEPIKAMVVIFNNEDGDPQAFGPVPGFMPIRLKIDVSGFQDIDIRDLDTN